MYIYTARCYWNRVCHIDGSVSSWTVSIIRNRNTGSLAARLCHITAIRASRIGSKNQYLVQIASTLSLLMHTVCWQVSRSPSHFHSHLLARFSQNDCGNECGNRPPAEFLQVEIPMGNSFSRITRVVKVSAGITAGLALPPVVLYCCCYTGINLLI